MSFGHTHGHWHPDGESRSAAAMRQQREGRVIGWVDGAPIGRERLDERIGVLRSGRLAGRLPAVASKEDRQFVRWAAQVLLTEELCRVEAARLSLVVGTGSRKLGQIEALHLGSINAAAWDVCAEMAALFEAVTTSAEVPVRAGASPAREWWRVRHLRAGTSAEVSEASEADLRSLGWTTLDDLPEPLSAAVRSAPLGTRVGPVESRLGWHVAVATERAFRPVERFRPADDSERFREFARWLDLRRRRLLTIAEGFEHPGDPAQPDNTHRH